MLKCLRFASEINRREITLTQTHIDRLYWSWQEQRPQRVRNLKFKSNERLAEH